MQKHQTSIRKVDIKLREIKILLEIVSLWHKVEAIKGAITSRCRVVLVQSDGYLHGFMKARLSPRSSRTNSSKHKSLAVMAFRTRAFVTVK